jgi:CheY-like chemotaxis protein
MKHIGTKTRVLIVEDEEKIAYTLARALRRASDNDFVVDIQNSPLEAIELFKTQGFDLLITDTRIPRLGCSEMIMLSAEWRFPSNRKTDR